MSKSLKSVSIDQMQQAFADALLQLTGDEYKVSISSIKFMPSLKILAPDVAQGIEFTAKAELPAPWEDE